MRSRSLDRCKTIPQQSHFLFALQKQLTGLLADGDLLPFRWEPALHLDQPRFQGHDPISKRLSHFTETKQLAAELLLEQGARGGAGHRTDLLKGNCADGIDAAERVNSRARLVPALHFRLLKADR